MPIKHLLIIYLIQFLLVALPGYGIANLFKKAGKTDSWKGYVPFLNTWEMQKMTTRKMHWVFWQFIPIVGWFITPGIFIEFVKLFGRFGIGDHIGASLAAPVYMPYIASKNDVRYIGADIVKKQRKGTLREWFDAAIFAIVAATLIRMFVFEAFMIPTGSMEKTLLVNDYLFVSKMSYGTRLPNTPLSFPFVHHTMPVVKSKSYLNWIKLPYIRWWAQPVKRNDIVVFNFPFGDTVALPRDSEYPFYDQVIDDAYEIKRQSEVAGKPIDFSTAMSKARDEVMDRSNMITRPVDKRENYVKRCVAVAGDELQIKNGVLYINNEKAWQSPTSTFTYNLQTSGAISQKDVENLGIRIMDGDFRTKVNNQYLVNLSYDELANIKRIKGFVSISPSVDSTYNSSQMADMEDEFGRRVQRAMADDHKIYPRSTLPQFQWTVDNFGPLWVPKKGVAIDLTEDNIIKYRRVIEAFEKQNIEYTNGKYTVNGATKYTFTMDYYWMMGDNRHNSQDSRYWGFVPEDHVVGKPKLIWMSWEGGPRWKRMFRMPK